MNDRTVSSDEYLPEGFYRCEFCGCVTNAHLRACCAKGREADMTTSQQDSISSKDYTRPPSTDELLVRAAGWLAAPEGESRQSTIELITGLVRSIKGFKKICAMHGLDTGLSALRDSNETPAPQAGADFDKDWARLEGIRSTMRDMQRYSLQGVPQSEVMFLLGFIDNLWRTFSRTDAKLEQYTKALWTANGFLIQLGREPVKLEYGPRLQQETVAPHVHTWEAHPMLKAVEQCECGESRPQKKAGGSSDAGT